MESGHLVPREIKKWKHKSLFERQRIIAAKNCYGNCVGLVGWPGGWLCTAPSNVSIDFDLGQPTLVTKIRMYTVNVLSTPIRMGLHVADSPQGPWTHVYALEHAQTNRMKLSVPPNVDDANGNESPYESFYFVGHRYSDSAPDDSEIFPRANRGLVKERLAGHSHVSQYWRFTVESNNGSHYIGFNNFQIFGTQNPLDAPADVRVVLQTDGASEWVRLTWTPVVGASKYQVIAYAAGDVGAIGYVHEVEGACECNVADLAFGVPHVFQVIAVSDAGEDGAPSEPSEPITLRDNHTWTELVAPDTTTTDRDEATWSDIESSLKTKETDSPEDGGATNKEEDEVVPKPKASVVVHSREKLEEINIMQSMKKQIAPKDVSLTVEQYAAQYNEDISAIMRGDFSTAPTLKNADQVLVFLSSTFDDTTTERNYFTEIVFPQINQMCQGLGLTFSTVDLRWGVRDEATDDHMTIDICLGELKRCLEQSTATSFVFLSGERYGWRALPNRVDAAELELLIQHVDNDFDSQVIRDWYIKDMNQLKPMYVLQKISSMAAKEGQVRVSHFWQDPNLGEGAQAIIQRAMRQVVNRIELNDENIRRNWMVSVTEREVLNGLIQSKTDTELGCLVLYRTIEGLKEAVDQQDGLALKFYTPVDEDRELLNQLRQRVKEVTPESSFREFTVPWSSTGISKTEHSEYVRNMAACFLRDMEDRIHLAMKKRRQLSDLEKEVLHHMNMAWKRSQAFFGRSDIIGQVTALTESSNEIGCVWGQSGSGKTSVICKVAVDTYTHNPNAIVLIRMCGTSPFSSSAQDLMVSICEQILIATGVSKAIPHSFDTLVQTFHELLNEAGSEEHPVYVFIDSLDQLNDSNGARTQPWKWLPKHISNPHTHLVVSTLPDAKYGILTAIQHVIAEDRNVEVKSLEPSQAIPILQEWLAHSGRTLTDAQLRLVIDSIEKAGNATMLHLRLIFDRVSTWRSYEDHTTPLPTTVKDLVRQVYEDLEHLNGRTLVSAVMGLICASRSGLSNENLLDLISGDDDVLGQNGQPDAVLRFHNPPVRRLPPLVFTRLKAQLKDYVVERDANGTTVLSLYHRQFWEVAEEMYLHTQQRRRELSSKLMDYFSGALSCKFPERNIASHPLRFKKDSSEDNSGSHVGLPNRQKLHELPHAQRGCGEISQLASNLCDLAYLEAVFDSGRLFAADLLREYQHAIAGTTSASVRSDLVQYFRFVSKWFHVLCMEPSQIVGLACNSAQTSVVAQHAHSLVESGQEKRRWLRWVNAPKTADPCVQTVISRVKLNGCAFSSDGQVYAVCGSTLCRVIDVSSASEVSRFQDHQEQVNAVCFSPDGLHVLSVGRDRTLMVWNPTNADLEHRIEGPRSWALSCAWHPRDVDIVATGHADGAVYLWQVSSGNCISVLHGHTGPVSAVAFSPNGSRIVSGSWDHTASIWTTTSPQVVCNRWSASGPINGVSWSEDGTKIALACSSLSCEVWVVHDSKVALLRHLSGHKSEVWACSFSPDSNEIVSVGADRRGLVFHVPSGKHIATVPTHPQWVMGCHWAGDKVLTIADNVSRLYERSLLPEQLPEPQQFMGLKFSHDGTQLYTITKTMKTCVYDPVTLEVIFEQQANGKSQDCGGADLSPDAKEWVYSAYSGEYRIVHNHKQTTSHTVEAGPFTVALWNPSGKREVVATGHGRTTCLFENPDRAEITKTFSHKGWVNSMDWSADGEWLVTAGSDATQIWDVANRNQNALYTFGPSHGVAFNHSKTHIAIKKCSGQGYNLETTGAAIIHIETGEEVVIDDKIVNGSYSQCLKWSSDDRYVFITSNSSSEFGCVMISVFDAETGKCVTRFCSPYQSSQGNIAVCRPDAPRALLATGDSSGSVYMFEMA